MLNLLLQLVDFIKLVGARGFEPPTTCTPCSMLIQHNLLILQVTLRRSLKILAAFLRKTATGSDRNFPTFGPAHRLSKCARKQADAHLHISVRFLNVATGLSQSDLVIRHL